MDKIEEMAIGVSNTIDIDHMLSMIQYWMMANGFSGFQAELTMITENNEPKLQFNYYYKPFDKTSRSKIIDIATNMYKEIDK